MFRVTRPYLNLLVKPRIFFRFSEKIFFIHFEGISPFKVHKIIFFPEIKIYVCLPYLKISDQLPETHLFFIWPDLIESPLGTYANLYLLLDTSTNKKRILGESSLPGKALRKLVDIARLAGRFNMHSQRQAW